MTSAKSTKKRTNKKRGLLIAATKPKPTARFRALTKKELSSFLELHVGEAADTYLRNLALQNKHNTARTNAAPEKTQAIKMMFISE